MLNTEKPIRRAIRACLAASVLATTLAACGTANWGFPYRPDVQQGNWLTSEQVAQLRQGMTRDQVRFILGTPTLQDIFHSNRWDYPYYNQPGYGKDELRQFTVWFENGQLVRWAGDDQPDRQPFQRADSGEDAIRSGSDGATAPAIDNSAAPNAGMSRGGGPQATFETGGIRHRSESDEPPPPTEGQPQDSGDQP